MCSDPCFVGAPLPLSGAARAPLPARAARPARPAGARMLADEEPPKPAPVRATPVAPPKSSATWANEWLPEFPRKGAGSFIGWDLRPSMLKGKDGGAGVCDMCRGTGGNVCTICNGHDFMGPNGKVVCNGCKGKHTVECVTCYGSGKQLDIAGEWWKVDFKKFLSK
jgi:hypothetical protein